MILRRRPRQPAAQLTDRRAKPAVFFCGKFRGIIDLRVRTAFNSNIRRIAVLSQ